MEREKGEWKGKREMKKKGLRWDLNPGPTEYRVLVGRSEQQSVLVSSWLVSSTTDPTWPELCLGGWGGGEIWTFHSFYSGTWSDSTDIMLAYCSFAVTVYDTILWSQFCLVF